MVSVLLFATMNARFLKLSLVPVLGALLLGSVSCRKKVKAAESKGFATATVVASELEKNRISDLPGAVYQSQVNSPIRWQPWTRESMDRAAAANRLVFAVIAIPQQEGFRKVLGDLAKDPQLVSLINDHYVPILIDGEASREIGLLTADLCSEIKRSLQLPLFLWMSPAGNPVAWIPVPASADSNVGDLFNQSHSMVNRTWNDDFSYVLKNSEIDNETRRQRVAQRKNSKVMSAEPRIDAVRGVRQLASFYDPSSRSFDEAGGLFPSGSLDLLATVAIHSGVPAEVRARCLETTRELLVDLLPSAMFDPLDGGVFSSRGTGSWTLPAFAKDCVSHARATVALFNAFRATGDLRAREKAMDLIRFAEKSFMTSEGLFALGVADESGSPAWLWTVDEITKLLPPEDAGWWIKATGMKELGNLASEADMRRKYFRSNSLGLLKTVEEIAAEESVPLEDFTVRFENARKTLLIARTARLDPSMVDDSSHAGATFRMVSAYAVAFAATGDEAYRKKATELLEKSKSAFSDGTKLRVFSKEAPDSIGGGRAFIYGLALQAALDVSSITSDEKWLVWAEDIATIAAELFTSSEFLKECPDSAKILDLPVTDLVMLFDDSTAGLVSFAECRLADRNRPLVKSFSELATPLPTYAAKSPILHTDLLQATIAREFKITVITGDSLSPELKLAVERLPLRMVQRRPAQTADEVPAGSVMIRIQGGESVVVSTPEALQQAVLPSPSN